MSTRRSLFQKTLICTLLAAGVIAVYWQVTGFDFINFDDPSYIIENPSVRQGLTLDGIKWAFVTVHSSNWHPLTWISLMLDVQLFGVNPGMHHLTNVIFHIINSILLFLVLERMTGAIWKCAVVASLFALHPLHVESVAWISERKDLLSTFFWMLTMMGYLWYLQQRNIWRFLLVALFYILGLLSKPMLVTLPFALLLLDFWPLERLVFSRTSDISKHHSNAAVQYQGMWPELRILITEKIPLIMLAFISSGMTFYAQQKGGAVVSQGFMSIGIRIANAIISYMAYLGKMFWPFNLAVYYPFPDVIHLLNVILCLLILLFISALTLFTVKRRPYLIVGWLWYLGTLVPVIGIVQVGAQSMADRYTYIPLIGIFIIVVWGLTDVIGRWRFSKIALGTISLGVITILAWTTWMQVSTWRNSITVFSHALQVTKNNDKAHLHLGMALIEKGDVDGALNHYREVVRLNPSNPGVYINLGNTLAEHKEVSRAIEFYSEGLKIDPNNVDIRIGLATLLEGIGKTDEAERHLNEALRVNPGSIEANNNLGNIMLRTGNYDEAIRHYTEVLRLDPHQAAVYNNLGTAFIYKGKIKKAIEYYQASIREKPDNAEAAANLKNVGINQKKLEDMLAKVQESTKADPQNPTLHTKLGDLYRQLGEYDEAIAQYNKAVSIQSSMIQPMYGLVLVYSDNQEYTKALDVLQNIRKKQPGNPEVYYNIACIYAKQNKTDESTLWLKQSIEKGFHNWDLIRKDPDLANIRDTVYVKELLKSHIKS
jgi:protein O-mannosyl-transferase